MAAGSSQNKPDIGRIVRFVPNQEVTDHNGSEVLPAMIVAVDEKAQTVNLQVFNNGFANFWWENAKYDESKQGVGSWHWPDTTK